MLFGCSFFVLNIYRLIHATDLFHQILDAIMIILSILYIIFSIMEGLKFYGYFKDEEMQHIIGIISRHIVEQEKNKKCSVCGKNHDII